MVMEARMEELKLVSNLAVQLWPEHSAEELTAEFEQILSQYEAGLFLKYADGVPAGFAYCQLRHDYVEGTESSPVGYLEGIFVHPQFRHRGYARELLRVCEVWARKRGCTEFASDCELGNAASIQFHKAVCFEEANRIVCFTKKL